MPDQQYGQHLSVKENALPAISQIRDQLADPVIVIVDHPPDSCCQIGFHAVPVSRAELPAVGFDRFGAIDEMEVAVEAGLMSVKLEKITLGFDAESGTLVAYVNQ